MVVMVHVPFADLANMQVVFEAAGLKAVVYGVQEKGEVIYFVKPELGDSMEHLAAIIHGSKVRLTFHDDQDGAYRSFFGETALENIRDLTPEDLDINS